MSMSREQAVDEIVNTYVELAMTEQYKNLPSRVLSDRVEAALTTLGVSAQELEGWAARSQAEMREQADAQLRELFNRG